MMATLNRTPDGFLVCVKGAPEEVLKKCNRIQRSGKVMDFQEKGEWEEKNQALANGGMRVLSFAYRWSAQEPDKNKLMEDLVYLGMAGYLDPPRIDVRDAIRDCLGAGIRVIMVTGDHAGTATAIAKQVGLDSDEARTLSGEIFSKTLSDAQREKILQASVFARVDPGQKLELISIFQEKKIVVAMTGDGVNDAPALKKADIGIAMGIRGTEAAREAADLILRDNAFPSIVSAIRYGRQIFENIRIFVIYLLSCNLAEILIVAAAFFFGLPLPLLPLQILFLNMVTDVFPALAIGMNRGDGKAVMMRKPRESSEPILSRENWKSIFMYSFCLSLAVLGIEVYTASILKLENSIVNTLTFYTLILAQLWHVFNMPEREVSFFKNQITHNPYIWYAFAICIVVTCCAYAIQGLRAALSLAPIELSLLILVITVSFVPIVLLQALKRGFKIIL
jgi:Ca2+-transporting ATPase